MREASERANISPPVNFHCARHIYALHPIMSDTAPTVVARNLGRADTRMIERHYGISRHPTWGSNP